MYTRPGMKVVVVPRSFRVTRNVEREGEVFEGDSEVMVMMESPLLDIGESADGKTRQEVFGMDLPSKLMLEEGGLLAFSHPAFVRVEAQRL